MGEHSEHCDDIACLGCECEPECDDCDCGVSRDYYAGMIEGRKQERERWVRVARERIIDLDSCAKDDDCATLVRGVLLVVGDALDEVEETE